MSIPEACGLVIEAGKKGKEGQTLILDMGKQKYITEIAEECFPLCKFKVIGMLS